MPAPREAPRLVKMLNDPTLGTGQPGNVPDWLVFLPQILLQIDRQLKQGLDGAVWDAVGGMRANPSSLEEQWARLYSEIVTFLPYITPGGLYGTSDVDIFQASTSKDGFYPLGFECQQHSTMGLILRGFDTHDFGYGCNAGASKGIPLFKGRGGTWTDGPFNSPEELLKAGAKPGTLVEFWPTRGVKNPDPRIPPDKKSDTNYGADHIALILRTHESDDGGDPKAVQFFDTGAVTIDGSDANRMAGVTSTTGGLCDDPWSFQSCQVLGNNPTGIGVTPDSNLASGITRGRSLFPLGLARLVIRNRFPIDPVEGFAGPPLAAGFVLFASPLLRMHTEADAFAVSRYAWSLRKLDNFDQFEARWQISTPRAPLVDPLRTRSPLLLRDVPENVLPKNKKIKDLNLCKLLDVVSQPDGSIKIERYSDHTSVQTRRDDAPWAEFSGVLGATQVPEYLRGGAPLPDGSPAIPSDPPPPSGPGRPDPPMDTHPQPPLHDPQDGETR